MLDDGRIDLAASWILCLVGLLLSLSLLVGWCSRTLGLSLTSFLLDRVGVLLASCTRLSSLSLVLVSLLLLLLHLGAILTFTSDELLRPFGQLLTRVCILLAALRVVVEDGPEVLHDQAILLLLVFGKTLQLEYIIGA